MLHLNLCFVLGWLAAACSGKSSTVCNPMTDLCFEEHFMAKLNVTVGFALPPKAEQQFADEVLVLGSFPLPYGFAGFMLGDPDSLNKQGSAVGLVVYVIFGSNAQASTSNFSIADCMAEMVTPATNNSLVPILNAPINATWSPLTKYSYEGKAAQFIFRCQNCSIVTNYFADKDEVKLTTLMSHAYPEYVDDTLTLANLSLAGEEHQESILNTAAARFSNYSSLLSAAGFV
ncbi:hypothetical protein C8R47DRAFT_1102216 [Mycena vitilis]|nr:hypothetical protein C8R47DRAFT_1102216 [Mycena vitilis]